MYYQGLKQLCTNMLLFQYW